MLRSFTVDEARKIVASERPVKLAIASFCGAFLLLELGQSLVEEREDLAWVVQLCYATMAATIVWGFF